jgi:hypothetical protein
VVTVRDPCFCERSLQPPRVRPRVLAAAYPTALAHVEQHHYAGLAQPREERFAAEAVHAAAAVLLAVPYRQLGEEELAGMTPEARAFFVNAERVSSTAAATGAMWFVITLADGAASR